MITFSAEILMFSSLISDNVWTQWPVIRANSDTNFMHKFSSEIDLSQWIQRSSVVGYSVDSQVNAGAGSECKYFGLRGFNDATPSKNLLTLGSFPNSLFNKSGDSDEIMTGMATGAANAGLITVLLYEVIVKILGTNIGLATGEGPAFLPPNHSLFCGMFVELLPTGAMHRSSTLDAMNSGSPCQDMKVAYFFLTLANKSTSNPRNSVVLSPEAQSASTRSVSGGKVRDSASAILLSLDFIYEDDMPRKLGKVEPGDEVVISGIAGRFPDSDNVLQLQENLFNKADLISDDDRRWKAGHMDTPHQIGKINHLEKFDANFFGIEFHEARTMDPMGRMLMEHAYEAIIDAGVNPQQLRGTNTGVFVGACYSESEKYWLYDLIQEATYGLTGSCRAMMANRISHWLGCTGPSCTVDTACSSSLFAMHNAYRAIRRGECDAALVGGCNLCLHPQLSLQFFLLGVLSSDGRCRSFDADAKGYCRSEAISMIYLQKCKDAKRIYAHVIHAKTNNDGFKQEGITYPSNTMQRALLEQFYEECGVPPSSLAYVEAHGTGTQVGDPVEADAIDKIFCPGRTSPLRIGSVKSNLGHTEPASGLCSIAKVIIAMETGFIPPNLHYNRPREGIKSLEEGRIEVISELTPWEGGYVGINSFGFGGGNAHVLLKSNVKEKTDNGLPSDGMPRLVVVSGRTKEAVTTLLDNLENRPVDVEYISLFHNIHAGEIPGHLYRGYIILPAKGLPKNCFRDAQPYFVVKRPICFVFSGKGSEWAGMGEALLKIPVFAKATRQCDAALKSYGVDVIGILTHKDPKIFDNILNTFVGITALQIGLVDVLTSIGIIPDITVGHSIGELGCAYADGCLTAEQTILAAYFEGLALIESKLIHGSMASVGLSYEKLKDICPADIDIACHDGPESTIISGPAESIREFIATLQERDISAQEESGNNIACHSRYVAKVGPKLLAYLQKVIPDPKPRSKKWLSTSVPRNDWELSSVQSCSPEYLTNNLLNSVLFEDTTRLVSTNAITIQIAPRSSQRKNRSVNENGINIVLTKRKHENNVEVLLEAIGKLYEVGLHPQLTNFYPKIEYPVSRGTPMISPFLRWDHSDDWYVVYCGKPEKIDSGERVFEVKLIDEAFEWMIGHVIDGRNLVPATGYLALVWETAAMMRGKSYTKSSVVFENVGFHRATTISKEGSVELQLMIQRGSGRFEVHEGGVTIVTGFVRIVANPARELVETKLLDSNEKELELTSRDIYKELRLRGYQYGGLFRGLKGASSDGTRGRIAWERNWVAFMDNMLQMKILGIDTRGLFVPTGIEKLVIDTTMHKNQLLEMTENDPVFAVEVDKDLETIVCGGVQIRGLKASAIARRRPAGDPVLEDFKFIAHRDRAQMELKVVIQMATHIALENMLGIKIKTIELIGDTDISPDNLTSPWIKEILGNIPLLQADVNIIAPLDKFTGATFSSDITISESKKLAGESGAFIVVSHGLLASKSTETLQLLKSTMSNGGFLLAREPLDASFDIVAAIPTEEFDVVLEKCTCNELLILLRKKEKLVDIVTTIHVNNNEFTWLTALQKDLQEEKNKNSSSRGKILLVSEGDSESGLLGLVNCLRREAGGEVIQGLLIQDLQAPKFSLDNPFYSKQLKLGLALNVLRPGKLWGSYRFFPINPVVPKPVYHARINQQTRGDMSAIKWVEGIIQPSFRHSDMIQVHYSSINFRDVMLATGKLAVEVAAKTRQAQESVIGFEFSGRDVDGRAVMGMIETGALSNLCICDRELLWAVPDNWTLEDAATVPAVYGTAYYALYLSGKMKRGDKVLIHAGSGGVGQAAITLALSEGCEVFTTVGTPQKREFIRKQFPEIDDDHIGNSRDTSFEQLVLRKTQGRGVDIVLNSLAEEKLQASVRCLATHGRFLEIGKFDLAANNPLGMEAFLKGISFHGILLDNLFTASSDRKTVLVAMLAAGIQSGAIKPLVRTVFPMDQTEAAFRYMAAGKHIGKVIVKVRGDEDVSPSQIPLALPRYHCSEECSYLIVGGLGGFGLELADWLVLRGAKKLVLTSRKGISTGYQRMRINIWKSYGVAVVVVAGKDVSTREGCEAILREAIALGPVSAIFNLAVVLEDAFFEDQTVEKFEESFKVKAWATKQFDLVSRTLCPQLKHFVVFSSVSCGRGNAGQTNYGMSNSIMERICETRVAQGLPGLAVQWGAIGDVGLVAEMQEDNREVVIGGTLQQRISSCLQELDHFLQQTSTVVSSMVVAEKRAGGAGAINIVDTVVNIMGLKDLKTVSMHTPLAELGMDSMMAVEIKQTLEREFDVFLTAADIRGLNFSRLQELSEKQVTDDGNLEQKVENQTEAFAGLRLLIRTLGTDLVNKDTCVPLVTRPQNAKREVFIVPGIEGTHAVLQSLANNLKSPTTCLQLGTNHLNSISIYDAADSLIPHVKARSKDRDDFVIAGYSFGSMVAIELVRRLESEGLKGRLVLIDGSPDYMKALMSAFLNGTEGQIQSNILLGIMDALAPSTCMELKTELDQCHTWEKKMAAFLKSLPENTRLNFTPEEEVAILSSFYSRIIAVRNYDSSNLPPLSTPIILIKPTLQSLRSMSEDYGLRSITRAKVDIFYADGDHLTILDDAICAAAIDGELIENIAIHDSTRT